jgi:LCP family protein required for cell wall assembly
MNNYSKYNQEQESSSAGYRSTGQNQYTFEKKRPKSRCGCCLFLLITPIIVFVLLILGIFLTLPGRSNILILGIDSRENSNLGRSDTNILMTIIPSKPYIGMLSIPRDLWVFIPNIGENRINTAHYFAEAQESGTGPEAAKETVQVNFGVDVHYYIRLHLIGFLNLVDALGGIDVNLPRAMSGYGAGTHHLSGEEALALVRDRAGSDDFSRMERGQIMIYAILKQIASPSSWSEIPVIWQIITANLDTDIPVWEIPSFVLTYIRIGTNGIDARIIDREMVVPFTSAGGASVLAPNWDRINPMLFELFGQ